MRRLPQLFAIVFFFAASSFTNWGMAAAIDPHSIRKQLDAAFDEIDRRSITVIVAASLDDGPIIVREFGDFKVDRVPASQTRVDLLSITKSVTAISVLTLVSKGELSLTDTLGELFRGVPDDKSDISVHHLLTHTAGVLDVCGNDHDALSKVAMLQCVFDSKLLAKPGSKYIYSNIGFSILAAIIEERSGKSFEKYLSEDVLSTAGIHGIGHASLADETRSMRAANGETVEQASWGGPKPYWNLIGNGGLITTAENFIRFRKALNSGDILSLKLVELAQAAHVAENPEGLSYYGYGVVTQEHSSVGPIVWHNGGSTDFSSDWNEIVDLDLTLFSAGLQLDGNNAYVAMEILRRHLTALHD